MSDRPKVRVQAGSDRRQTADSFNNALQRLGIGQANTFAGTSYAPTYMSRNRMQLDAMYRGSWLVGAAVDCVAEDMCRAGIEYLSGLDPDQISAMNRAERHLGVWDSLRDGMKWARLYGGALVIMLVDGQQLNQPLRMDTITKGSLKGLVVVDRWMVQPSLSELVTDPGPDMGYPSEYYVLPGYPIGSNTVHYTRVLRLSGTVMPWYQRQVENYWGTSVIERIYDRLAAYDTTTIGAAQLVSKAYLRVLKIHDLRELLAVGGKMRDVIMQQIDFIRELQSSEGLTVLDSKDDFQSASYSFAGLAELLIQFAQQFSGALGIPLVRLLGQSPAGLNSTGDSDWENYYGNISQQQETHLRWPLTRLLKVMIRSTLGVPESEDFDFRFTSLWQVKPSDKADLAQKTLESIGGAFDRGIIDKCTALKEMRQASEMTGIMTNITDEIIDEAEQDPPDLNDEIDHPLINSADPHNIPGAIV